MSQIAKFLPANNVLLDVQASSKKRIFEHVSLLFENNHGIASTKVFDSLLARERMGSTGLGEGVAVPHGRIKGIREPVCAFVRLTEAVQFDAPDGLPVKLLFFLLVPEHSTQQHLEILSEIAQMFSDAQFRTQLFQEISPDLVHQSLLNWQPFV